jgi:hypothetical protein
MARIAEQAKRVILQLTHQIKSPRQAYVDLDMFTPRFRGDLNSQRGVVIRETPEDGQRCQ